MVKNSEKEPGMNWGQFGAPNRDNPPVPPSTTMPPQNMMGWGRRGDFGPREAGSFGEFTIISSAAAAIERTLSPLFNQLFAGNLGVGYQVLALCIISGILKCIMLLFRDANGNTNTRLFFQKCWTWIFGHRTIRGCSICEMKDGQHDPVKHENNNV
jgi:hypothetical protein